MPLNKGHYQFQCYNDTLAIMTTRVLVGLAMYGRFERNVPGMFCSFNIKIITWTVFCFDCINAVSINLSER